VGLRKGEWWKTSFCGIVEGNAQSEWGVAEGGRGPSVGGEGGRVERGAC